MEFPTDFTVEIKSVCPCTSISECSKFKMIIGTFEYSKIGLKIESELSLDLGALKYYAYQHLISHLEF